VWRIASDHRSTGASPVVALSGLKAKSKAR
jgi:hypothetical protein